MLVCFVVVQCLACLCQGKNKKNLKKHKKRRKSSVEVDKDIESWLDFVWVWLGSVNGGGL